MNSRPVGLLFAAVGVLGIALGVVLFFHSNTPLDETAHTTGTVVNGSFAGGTGCINTATFVVHGHTYHAYSTTASAMTCQYKDGAKVTVNYSPSDPSTASIPAQSPYHLFGPLIFIVIGAVFAIVGTSTALGKTAQSESDQGEE
jgi:Protein of unknown function (DUF3592)